MCYDYGMGMLKTYISKKRCPDDETKLIMVYYIWIIYNRSYEKRNSCHVIKITIHEYLLIQQNTDKTK